MPRILLTFAVLLIVSLPASAQQLKLSFRDGRVSLDATSVPVRTILNEWARLGGTTVIGSERIAGSPLTLKLDNVSEAQALEIVLRSVAGYMAAPRRAAAVAGASIYDRILVMATSAAPSPAARTTPNPGAGAAGNQRFVPQRPPVRQADPDEEPDDEPDPNPPNAPVFTFPQPGQNAQPGMIQNLPPGLNGQPVITINPNTGAPQSITINPANPGAVPTLGAPTPGMIVAPPPQQGQPGAMVRPPGGA